MKHTCVRVQWKVVSPGFKSHYRAWNTFGMDTCKGCISDAIMEQVQKKRDARAKMMRSIFDSQNPVTAYICELCDEPSFEEYCECCEHDFDPDEGMMCINCNMEYPY